MSQSIRCSSDVPPLLAYVILAIIVGNQYKTCHTCGSSPNDGKVSDARHDSQRRAQHPAADLREGNLQHPEFLVSQQLQHPVPQHPLQRTQALSSHQCVFPSPLLPFEQTQPSRQGLPNGEGLRTPTKKGKHFLQRRRNAHHISQQAILPPTIG